MLDISNTSNAHRTRRLNRTVKDNLTSPFQRPHLDNINSSPASDLSAHSSPHPATIIINTNMDAKSKATASSASSHMGTGNGYSSAPGRVPPSATDQQDSGTTLPSSDDPMAHGVSNANGGSAADSSSPVSTPGLVPKLSYSNYTFWYMSLRLAAALYRCEDHIITDPPPPADLEGKDTHRRAAAQAWLLLTQSVPEEIRHQLTIDDLSSTPHNICDKLKQVVLSRPENSRTYLMNRAQSFLLRRQESMSDYLAGHDDIRQRMILVDHIKEDDEATTILFVLCGLRQNADYSDVCAALSVKSGAGQLTLAALKHDLLKEEQYLKSKPGQGQVGQGYATSGGSGSAAGTNGSGGNGNGSNDGLGSGGGGQVSPRSARTERNGQQNGSTGLWCSFHEVSTHNTEQCQAKARHEAMANKWCTFHEVNTHDTGECKAKARHETMGTKWCSFHESHSHNTDECEAKRRQEDYQNKWCSFHESHTHNTDECQAKARHDALYAR